MQVYGRTSERQEHVRDDERAVWGKIVKRLKGAVLTTMVKRHSAIPEWIQSSAEFIAGRRDVDSSDCLYHGRLSRELLLEVKSGSL